MSHRGDGMIAQKVDNSLERALLPGAESPVRGVEPHPVQVSPLPVPYPYRAALAICSDLDETPSLESYLEMQRFICGTSSTSMGRGLGLEIGNTLYFDMPAGHLSYWNADAAGRRTLRTLIRSGHIDCLHSFGDLARTREHARMALEELATHGLGLRVWVDHAQAISNLGADIMLGQGDVPESPAYHADLLADHGIRFIWRGRVTSMIGQNRSPSLRSIWTAAHPLASARTLAKEAAKVTLAHSGNAKYAIHAGNRLLRQVPLRDGRSSVEFLRCNPYWEGVQHGATAAGLAEVLVPRVLDRLTQRRGLCVIYTHMGKVQGGDPPFGPHTQAALRLLAERFQRQDIWVTTTRRLLGYANALEALEFVATERAGVMSIECTVGAQGWAPVDREDLAGLSFTVPPAQAYDLHHAGRCTPLTVLARGLDNCIVGIRWKPAEFPDV